MNQSFTSRADEIRSEKTQRHSPPLSLLSDTHTHTLFSAPHLHPTLDKPQPQTINMLSDVGDITAEECFRRQSGGNAGMRVTHCSWTAPTYKQWFSMRVLSLRFLFSLLSPRLNCYFCLYFKHIWSSLLVNKSLINMSLGTYWTS